MIDGLFIFRLVLSFFVGGIVIVAVTRVSELLGPKVGGILSSIPTTGLVGMIFLGITADISALPKAAPAMLIGFGVSLLLLSSYAHMRRRNFSVPISLTLATLLWLTLMIAVGRVGIHSVLVAFSLYLVCFLVATIYFKNAREISAKKTSASTTTLLMRGVFAGTIVASTVLLARLINPIWGGVASAFPALYLSSIVILENQQSKEFTASVLKNSSLGNFSLALFAIAIAFTAQRHSLTMTIILSMMVSLAFSVGLYLYRTKVFTN